MRRFNWPAFFIITAWIGFVYLATIQRVSLVDDLFSRFVSCVALWLFLYFFDREALRIGHAEKFDRLKFATVAALAAYAVAGLAARS